MKALVGVLVLGLLAAGLAGFALMKLDPINAFVQDGHLVLRGSIDKALIDYLQHGPSRFAPSRTIMVSDGHPTGRYVTTGLFAADDFPQPSSGPAPQQPRPVRSFLSEGARALEVLIDSLRRIVAFVLFGWWTGDASAACAGGNCFWIGGTGNFSDTTKWSTTSGGASCACTPGATDTVTFNAVSGAGTATQNNASFTSGAVDMSLSSVTVAGSTNTWNVGGGWKDESHFSAGTSTVIFTAGGTWDAVASGKDASFNNLTDNVGVAGITTLGTAGNYAVTGTLTLANLTTISGNTSVWVQVGNTPTFGTGLSINTVQFLIFGTSTWPASTVYALCVDLNTTGNVTLGGNLTTTGTAGIALASCAVGDGLAVYTPSAKVSGFVAGGNTVNVNAGGVVHVASSTSWISSTAGGSWTVTGAWTNASTSASWSFAAQIMFNASASKTMTFCACGSGTEFSGNVTLDQGSGGTGTTYTMATNPLTVSASAITTIKRTFGTGTTTLDTSGSNLAMTIGALTVAANASLLANSSTVTLNGNYDTSAGSATHNSACSTVVFAATATLKTSGNYTFNGQNFCKLTINNGATVTTLSNFYYNGASPSLTVNGTLTLAGGTEVGAYDYQASPTVTGPVGTGTINGAGAYKPRWGIQNELWGQSSGPALSMTGGMQFAIINQPFGGLGTLTLNTALTLSGTLSIIANAAYTTSFDFRFDTNGKTLSIAGLNLDNQQEVAQSYVYMTAGTSSITVSGNLVVGASNNGFSYITSGGSGSWTVGGTWTNNSTSSSWSFGASIVFNASSSKSMHFDSDIPQEFSGNVTFAGTGTYTMSAGATSGNLVVGGTLAISSGTLNAATFSVSFMILSVPSGSQLRMGTTTTTAPFSMSASSGIVTLSSWATYSISTGGIVFTAADSVATDPVVFSFSGLAPSALMQEIIDGVVVAWPITDSIGNVQFTVQAWTSHQIALYWSPAAGGANGWGFTTTLAGSQTFDLTRSTWDQDITFTVTGQLPSSSPTTYRWDFGDGTPVTTTSSSSVTHHYDFGFQGSYTVSVIACGPRDCGLGYQSFTFVRWSLLEFVVIITMVLSVSVLAIVYVRPDPHKLPRIRPRKTRIDIRPIRRIVARRRISMSPARRRF